MTVRVYTKPECRQCDMTKRLLDREGVSYVTEDLTDPGNLAAARSLGHSSAPVVVVEGDSWSGFQPERIKQIKQRIEGEQ